MLCSERLPNDCPEILSCPAPAYNAVLQGADHANIGIMAEPSKTSGLDIPAGHRLVDGTQRSDRIARTLYRESRELPRACQTDGNGGAAMSPNGEGSNLAGKHARYIAIHHCRLTLDGMDWSKA